MSKRSLVIVIGVIILMNVLGATFFFRWDLTQDKRYAITPATKNMLQDLETPVTVTVYLDGNNMPAGFERLKRAIKETLSEFKRYSGQKFSYNFINPQGGNDTEKARIFEELAKKGITPTNVYNQKGGQKSETLVFPYAVIHADGKEDVVLLLKSNQALSTTASEKLNQSYENIEYSLASSIQKLTNTHKKNIGLLTEFTSKKPLVFAGMIESLKDFYNLYIIDAKASPTFDGLDALIVPAPDKPIDDSTKFKIDQFIMHGGKALFFIDGLNVDTLNLEGTFAQPLDINLDDLLFKYGLRINKNIVKDGLNAAVIPMVVGQMGNDPNIQPVPYRYFPLINNFGKSIITKNMDMVLTKYAGTIDTVNSGEGLKKTPLLLTSPYTKILNAPALITFNEARTDTDEKEYNAGEKVVGYMVEGKFKSLFRQGFTNTKPFVAESVPTKILLVSDGDLIQNETNPENGTFYKMGYDRYFKHQYGNEDFLLTTLNYMLDEDGILVSKSKTVSIRPLDSLKIKNNRSLIQLINIVLPLLILAGFGLARYFYVKQKYAKN